MIETKGTTMDPKVVADQFIAAIEHAIERDAKFQKAYGEYNAARKALVDAIARKASAAVLDAVYVPAMQRKAYALLDHHLTRASEKALWSEIQSLRFQATGKI